MRVKVAALITILLFCTGCKRFADIRTLDELGPDEALAVGKITVLIDGKEATVDYLAFQQVAASGAILQRPYLGPNSPTIHVGDFAARLPVGTNGLWIVQTGSGMGPNYRYDFTPNEATFSLPKAGGVYYVGHLTINASQHNTVGASGGLVAGRFLFAGIIGAVTTPKIFTEIEFRVDSNVIDAHRIVSDKFDSDTPIDVSLTTYTRADKDQNK
jgi:hypothetical protein